MQNLNCKEILLEWLSEITFGNKDLYYKVREDTEEWFSIYLYTDKHRYCISCRLQYLGCTYSCRTPKPGEFWTRGGDLPDGNFCKETWNSIKNSIIQNELIQICRCDACTGRKSLPDEIGECK